MTHVHTLPSGYGGCERCLMLGPMVVLFVDGDDERMCVWCAEKLEARIAREDEIEREEAFAKLSPRDQTMALEADAVRIGAVRAGLERQAREPAMVEA